MTYESILHICKGFTGPVVDRKEEYSDRQSNKRCVSEEAVEEEGPNDDLGRCVDDTEAPDGEVGDSIDVDGEEVENLRLAPKVLLLLPFSREQVVLGLSVLRRDGYNGELVGG